MKTVPFLLLIFLLTACQPSFILSSPTPSSEPTPTSPPRFDGERALGNIERQLSFGPRTPSSAGHAQILSWLLSVLQEEGWEVELQEEVVMGHTAYNVVARRGEGSAPILLGAHYDTRLYADRDQSPARRNEPVPGANDGASGVAVLLELARVLPKDLPDPVWLVFFDLEDNGDIAGWDWILGSRAFVENLEITLKAAVIVDMIGDTDLNIHKEHNSTPSLQDEIWDQAAELGYEEYFLSTPKYAMIDDHTPFLEAGIPAVDIIDFDYPYWHTTEDTLDKVSAHSLQVVGDTLLAWLLKP